MKFLCILLCFVLQIPFVMAAPIQTTDFGINHIYDNPEVASDMGFGIERVNLIWKNLQKEPFGEFDAYTQNYLHNVIDTNSEFGMETLLLLERPPTSVCGEVCPAIEDVSMYEDFLTKVLTEYGEKVTAIEIYNEPDREVHWPPKPNPDNYVELLRATKRIRDDVSPGLQIVLGGMSGPPNPDQGYTFLYDVLERDAAEYFDVFNYHHYTQNQAPDEGWGHPKYWYSIFEDAFAQYEISKPIWVTEFGYATAGEIAGEIVTESEQASNLVKMYTQLFQLPLVEKVFLFELFDAPDNPLKYGVMVEKTTPKPSYYAVEHILSRLNELYFDTNIHYENSFVSHSVFRNADVITHVLWLKSDYVYPKPGKINENISESIELNYSYEDVSLWSVTGDRLPLTIQGNTAVFEITGEPVFFVEQKDVFSSEAIDMLIERDIASGFADGQFHPEKFITRAELLKIASRAFYNDVALSEGISLFPDIPSDHWVIPYVVFAKNAGIISGNSDGTFAPDQRVSRYEALKILIESSQIRASVDPDFPYTDVSSDNAFFPYIQLAYHLDVIKESPYFHGDKFLYRGEMAQWVAGLLQ